MNILFVHQNFPGQFKHLAPALVAQGHRVVALTMQKPEATVWQGVQLVPYQNTRGNGRDTHSWVSDFETKAIRGEAALRAAIKLKESGFSPDVIIAHPGWGESLFLKQLWPTAKLGIYCEFYYRAQGADVGFDAEFESKEPVLDACRLQLKNINNLLHFQQADVGISPTHWQASTFPEPFRSKITVVHDGIDTQAIQPNAGVTLKVIHRDRRDQRDVYRVAREDYKQNDLSGFDLVQVKLVLRMAKQKDRRAHNIVVQITAPNGLNDNAKTEDERQLVMRLLKRWNIVTEF